MVLSKVLPRVKAAICLDLSQEARFDSPRYFFATYCCNFLMPLGLSANRMPEAAATFAFSSKGGILCHQSRAKSKSCSQLMKCSEVTCFKAVLAPSLIPLPSLKITCQPKDTAISRVLSVLRSSTMMRLPTNPSGITSLIRFRTRGKVWEPFLVHITKSTLSINDISSYYYLSRCPYGQKPFPFSSKQSYG